MKKVRTLILCLLVIFFLSNNIYASCLKAVKVSGGEDHTMVLTDDPNYVFACGYNGDKQLGNSYAGFYETELIQVEDVAGTFYLSNIRSIAAGWKHSMALDYDKYVYAWGSNTSGQLGIGNSDPCSLIPAKVLSGEQGGGTYLHDIEGIASGRSGRHSLACDSDGYCWAWGIKDYGQLGNGEQDLYAVEYTPVRVHDLDNHDPDTTPSSNGLTDIIAVAAGANNSMALEKLSEGGNVFTWGSNDYGKLGIGGGSDYNYPQQVLKGQQNSSTNYLENIIDISAGWDHCLVLDEDHYVYAWGINNGIHGSSGHGALGNNSTSSSDVPVQVQDGDQDTVSGYLENIIQVAAGEGYSMALDEGGHVWTWGSNNLGQLGNGTSDPCSLVPVQVVGGEMGTEFLENIVYISAGYWHGLAVDNNGNIWSWGKGQYGRLGLGDDDTDNHNTPQLMICPQKLSGGFFIEKTAAIENSYASVDPTDTSHDEIDYTINYDPCGISHTGVFITDELPDEVYCEPCSVTNGGVYDWLTHTITWDLGSVSTSGSVQFSVIANELAKPGGVITNHCEIESDIYYDEAVPLDVDVTCWNTNSTIFVDDTASGSNNGTSWTDAYHDLRDALNEADARSTKPSSIWVADGTYCPGSLSTDTFQLVSPVDMIGGLAGGEDPATYNLNNRNLYAIKSILTGNGICNDIVKADNTITSTTLLDGFTIGNANQDGVYLNNASPIVSHCTIKNNGRYGLYCSGNNVVSAIENCNIYDNENSGIRSEAAPIIKNNWIHHNGYAGISYNSLYGAALIRNNTIAYNESYAVEGSGIYTPTLANCIFWGNYYNNGNDPGELYGCTATYSCIDPNDPCLYDSNPDASNNILYPPEFAYSDLEYDPCLYDFHLSYDSNCKDAGSNSGISGEYDIDNDNRIYNSTVDMGADEVDCEEISRPHDINTNGLINLHEFSLIYSDWQTTGQNLPGDFDNSGTVDIDDYVELLDPYDPDDGGWLWAACWRDSGGIGYQSEGGDLMMMGMSLSSESLIAPPTLSAEDQIDQLYDIVNWMTATWSADSETLENEGLSEDQWQDTINLLYDIIDGLED